MAYSTSCPYAPRISLFSNPNKSYAGKPSGSNTEDNARAIREAMVR
ncbi:unnamed protein product, partial [Discosporangium mesarthrocarpum]